MSRGRLPPTLAWRLTLRMLLVAALSAFVLLAFFIFHYLRNPAELSQQTLDAEAAGIAAALEAGDDPAGWPMFREYPHAYAFRAFDKGRRPGERMLGGANITLLPPLQTSPDQTDPILRLRERFEALPRSDGSRGENRWMLTSRETVGNSQHGIWVQTVMIGDPAWRWRIALGDEMLVHVVIPAGVLVPTMALAMILVIQRALRPLTRISDATRTLSLAASRGMPLPPLPHEGLTRELHALVRAVNAMLGTLDATLGRERAFAADAAHELRTPLAVLRLQVAELPKSAVAEQLDQELAGLAHLVSQLLRFAQAEEVMAAERHAVDVVEIARLICEDMAPAALARQQELAFVAVEQAVMVFGNPSLLGVALRNLVENAMRAAPRGSTVTVGVTPYGLTVDDCGQGVADANKSIIFDRLWQADRRREGAGIGLALVRRIAQLHDGAAWVEDRPGGGARFVLRLAPPSETAA